MEPEKDFLDNATLMVTFAQKEIKQFLVWTGKNSPYRESAEEITSELTQALALIKKLQQRYQG